MRPIPLLCILGILTAAATADATQHSAIINIEGCAGITGASKGYATPDSLYWVTDDMMNDGTTTTVVLCDADLPADATGFDYAELEYIAGETSNSPWVAVFATGNWSGPGGVRLSWLQEIGWCGGGPGPTYFAPFLPTAQPSPPTTVCQTSGTLDWSAMQDQALAARLSIVFLVVLPGILPSWDGNDDFEPSQTFRIVEYFEQ